MKILRRVSGTTAILLMPVKSTVDTRSKIAIPKLPTRDATFAQQGSKEKVQ